MPRQVKNSRRGRGRLPGQTRISSKHQVTIPTEAFTAAGLKPGDTLKAVAAGPGQVVLSRQEDLLDQYSGALRGGSEMRRMVEDLRAEWE